MLILFILTTFFKKLVMYELHCLFVPDLFHVHASNLKLEIT